MIRHKYINRVLAGVLAVSMMMGQSPVTALAEGTTDTSAEAQAQSEAESRAAAEAQAQSEAESRAAAEAQAQSEAESRAAAEAQAQSEADSKAAAEAQAQSEADSRAAAEAAAQSEAESKAAAEAAAQSEADSKAAAEAAATEKVTEPKQTEAQTTVTTEAQTSAATETPQTETTTSAQTENPTEKVTEPKQTESESETETEKVEMSDVLEAKGNGLKAELKLPKGQELPKNSVLTVEKVDKKEQEAAEKYIRTVTDEGHREMTSAIDYKVTLKVDDEEVDIPAKAVLTITFDKPLDLQIGEYMQGEAAVYNIINKKAVKLGAVELDKKLKVGSITIKFNGKISNEFAIAGVSNLINDGVKLTSSDLKENLSDLTDYAVVANVYKSEAKSNPEEIAAGRIETEAQSDEKADEKADEKDGEKTDEKAEEEADMPTPQEIAGDLDKLSDYSLELANAQSTGSVTVVNVYADSKGNIDTEPLEAVLGDKNDEIDVTDSIVVINVVADNAAQELTLPAYKAVNDNVSSQSEETKDTVGKLLFNFVALDASGDFEAYTGTLIGEDKAEGTYLAADAESFELSNTMTGAAYTNMLYMAPDSELNMAALLSTSLAVVPNADLNLTSVGQVAPDGNEKKIKIKVIAVDRGDTKEEKTPLAGAVFTVEDENGDPLENTNAEKLTLTRPENSGEGVDPDLYEINADEYEALKSLVDGNEGDSAALYITESTAPDGYVAVTEKQKVEVVEKTDSTETLVVTFENRKKIEAPVSLKLTAVDTDAATEGTLLKDAVISVKAKVGEEEKDILDADGNPLTFTTTDAADQSTLQIDPEKYPVLTELLNAGAESVTLVLSQTTTPDTYESVTEAQEVVYDLKNNKLDKAELVFNNRKQRKPVSVKVTAVDADTEKKDLIPGAVISVKVVTEEGEKELLDADGKALTFTTAVQEQSTETTTANAEATNTTTSNAAADVNLHEIDPAKYPALKDAKGEVTLILAQTTAPEGYYGITEPIKLTYKPAESTIAPAEAVFENKKPVTKIEIKAEPVAEDKTTPLEGAAYSIAVKDAKEDLSVEKILPTADDKFTTFVIDAANIDALKNMAADTSVTLVVKETVIPTGYVQLDPIQQEVTITKDANGNYTASATELLFAHRVAKSVSITVRAIDNLTNNKALGGASFTLLDANHAPIQFVSATDTQANTFIMDKEGTPYTMTIDESRSELLRKMENGTTMTLTISELKAPGGYIYRDGTSKTVTITKGADGELSVDQAELVFEHREVDSLLSAGVFTAKKKNYLGDTTDTAIYAKNGDTYYAALFKKDEATGELFRVTDVQAIKLEKGKMDGSTIFKYLEPGTYILRETDAFGKIVGVEKDEKKAAETNSKFYAVYTKTDTITVSEGHYATSPTKATIENHYFKLPKNYTATASFYITKKVVDSTGKASGGEEKFNIVIYDADTNKKIGTATIDMKGYTSRTVKKSIPMTKDVKKLRIVEEGYDTSKYESSIDKSVIELKAGQTTIPQVTVTNKKIGVVDTFGDGKATLKLQKSVTYKGQPVRVNAVYYIGIWTDPDLTKKPYYIRPMTLKNASTVVADLTINLNKTDNKKITFYFAEVTKSGKVVTSETNSEYDISLNKQSITLSAENMKDTLVLTNAIKVGGGAETRLTDPGSGFAGDTAALAEAQELEKSGNSSAGTKTGDDNPIVPLAIALCLSAAVIVAISLIFRSRRKKK